MIARLLSSERGSMTLAYIDKGCSEHGRRSCVVAGDSGSKNVLLNRVAGELSQAGFAVYLFVLVLRGFVVVGRQYVLA